MYSYYEGTRVITLRKQWVIPLTTIVLLLSLMLTPNLSVALSEQTDNLNTGPYVDQIVYSVIGSPDSMVLALLGEEIDLYLLPRH